MRAAPLILIPLMPLSGACGPKQAGPEASAEVRLEGAWYLLDTPIGPPSGRLTLDDGEAMLVGFDGRRFGFSYSAEGRGVELRGDDGGVLLAEPAGPGALRVYAASGASSIAYPITPLPADALGSWILRDPALPAGRPLRIVAGAPDKPASMVVDGRALDLWTLSLPEGPGWVLLPPDNARPGDGRVWSLHAIDGGAWLVTGPLRGKARVLSRPGETPVWVGADTGDAPEGPDPYFPVDRRVIEE